MQTTIALNPIPVAIIFLALGIHVVALWLQIRSTRKRLKTLERIFEIMRGEENIVDVRTITAKAGTDIRAGEPVFIAEDGNAYPASLREQKP